MTVVEVEDVRPGRVFPPPSVSGLLASPPRSFLSWQLKSLLPPLPALCCSGFFWLDRRRKTQWERRGKRWAKEEENEWGRKRELENAASSALLLFPFFLEQSAFLGAVELPEAWFFYRCCAWAAKWAFLQHTHCLIVLADGGHLERGGGEIASTKSRLL